MGLVALAFGSLHVINNVITTSTYTAGKAILETNISLLLGVFAYLLLLWLGLISIVSVQNVMSSREVAFIQNMGYSSYIQYFDLLGVASFNYLSLLCAVAKVVHARLRVSSPSYHQLHKLEA